MKRFAVAVAVLVTLPLLTAAECGSSKKTPVRQLQIVEVKKKPRGKVRPGDLNCWELQLKIVNTGGGVKARNFICVEKGTWDSYKEGDIYP